MNILIIKKIILLSIALDLNSELLGAGLIYTLTGSGSTGNELLVYDAESFALRGGIPQGTVGFLNDLATDESGRLFGTGSGPGSSLNSFYEFDPLTRSVINQVTRESSVGGAGLAAYNGRIYTLTGSSSSSLSLLSYNADTFELIGGTPQNSVGSLNDLTFDVTGRLFGTGNGPGSLLNSFYEFDPITLEVINHRTRDSWVGGAGLAAYNGRIYTLSGSTSSSSGALLAYDADTFDLILGAPQGTVGFLNDLAFDQTGRLFGIGNGPGANLNSFYEFDPLTLMVINQGTRNSSAGGAGLAVIAMVPEPSSWIFCLCGLLPFLVRRRN